MEHPAPSEPPADKPDVEDATADDASALSPSAEASASTMDQKGSMDPKDSPSTPTEAAKDAPPNETQTSEDDRDWSAGRLSAVEAETFAEAFRPSWGGSDSWSSPSPPTATSAPDEPRPRSVAPAPSTDDEPTVLPGATNSTKTIVVIAAVFLLVIGGVVLSFVGGETPTEVASAAPSGTGASTETSMETAPRPTEGAEQPEHQATRAQSAPALEPRQEEEEDPAPPPPATIRIEARTVPINARLELDGVRVGNPLFREAIADGSTHVLRVSADGYETRELRLVYSEALSEIVELQAIAPPPTMEPPQTRRRTTTMRSSTRSSMRTAGGRMRSSRRTMRATRMSSGFTTANPY